MTTSSYEQKTARLVHEATGQGYQRSLNLVRKHQEAHPEHMTKEARALAILTAITGEPS